MTDRLRINSKIIFEMIKSKVPHYTVPDTSKLNINMLIDLLDDGIFIYIQNSETEIKGNDKIILLYKHLLTMTEHHNSKKGYFY